MVHLPKLPSFPEITLFLVGRPCKTEYLSVGTCHQCTQPLDTSVSGAQGCPHEPRGFWPSPVYSGSDTRSAGRLPSRRSARPTPPPQRASGSLLVAWREGASWDGRRSQGLEVGCRHGGRGLGAARKPSVPGARTGPAPPPIRSGRLDPAPRSVPACAGAEHELPGRVRYDAEFL